MSEWKLVEALPASPEPSQREQQQHLQEEAAGSFGGRGMGRGGRGRGGGGRGRGGGGRGRGGLPFRSKADRSYFAFLAVQQIDLIFSPDSLCMDTYVRSYMDCEGYVPIALVCNYYNVSCFQSSYPDILHKLVEVQGRSKYYELDVVNETIRLKEGWEKYVMVNAYGGRGLPRYIKQPSYVYDASQQSGAAAEATAAEETTTDGAAAQASEGQEEVAVDASA